MRVANRTIIPVPAAAPTGLAGAVLLGAPPSWPMLATWATVAALMVMAPAVAHSRRARRGQPRGRRPQAMRRARRIPLHGRSAGAAGRFDPAGFEPLADRMACLLREFLAAAVPRPGRPARLDLRAPATTWFVDAFTAASDLLVGTSQADRPETLAAAVREAERRWGLLDGWSRRPATYADDPPAPARGPAGLVETDPARPDDPDAADHDPRPS